MLVYSWKQFIIFSPAFVSHTWIIWSSEPETMWVPSAEKATDWTESVCPLRGFITSSPVFASHTLIVWSQEPETMQVPSAEKATDSTEFVCPRNSSSSLQRSWR